MLLIVLIISLVTCKVDAFGSQSVFGGKSSRLCSRSKLFAALHANNNNNNDNEEASTRRSSRRELLVSIPALALPLLVSNPSFAADQESRPRNKDKILILGSTGFVGSQVIAILKEMGIETIGTSRNGRDGTVALNFNDKDVQQKVERLASGCTAVISCVGAIGTANDFTVNAGTGLAAQGAKAVGSVQKFVYITVAPEVKEFARNVDFLEAYMAGKSSSQDLVVALFQENGILIAPTFIYGGGSFELNPPRVASFYGQFIEGILSSSPIRNVERLLSPGFVKIALEPPVPVEDVAKASVAGALGETTLSILDSYDKIKQASLQLS